MKLQTRGSWLRGSTTAVNLAVGFSCPDEHAHKRDAVDDAFFVPIFAQRARLHDRPRGAPSGAPGDPKVRRGVYRSAVGSSLPQHDGLVT
jgi:hypothetical protein